MKIFRLNENQQRQHDKKIAKERRDGKIPPPPHRMPHQRMLRRTMAKRLAKQKKG